MPLSATIQIALGGTLTQDDTVAVQTDTINGQSLALPMLSFGIADGTGAGQASKWYRAKRTIAAGANDDLDLSGVLASPLTGATLAFTGIKAIIISIYSPDGTKLLRVGPGSVSNPWSGPIKGTTPYIEVPYVLPLISPSAAGWSVTAGTGDILRITNPGATSVDYFIWIVGI
jgi:hypothetical protein